MNLILVALLALSPGCNSSTYPNPKDEGFIKVEETGKDIHWDRAAIPLVIFVHPSAAMWIFHTRKAVNIWNKQLGFEAFKVSIELHGEAGAFLESSPGIVPLMGFPIDQGCDGLMGCNPHTLQRALKLDGSIVATSIWMPSDLTVAIMPDAYLLVLHELGHVLGLTHDETISGYKLWSIMEPALDLSETMDLSPPPITRADIRRLREWYVE